jgi:hypothetical protein
LGQGHGRFRDRTGSEQDGQQLGVAQRSGPVLKHAFSRSFLFGDIAQSEFGRCAQRLPSFQHCFSKNGGNGNQQTIAIMHFIIQYFCGNNRVIPLSGDPR